MTVRNLNLVESLYADLRRRLQLSEIGPDDRLVDTDIAEAYGASRMPAREALLRLVAEGYLVGSTRGFVLPVLSPEDIAGIFELRRQLEPRAAGAAARDLTPDAAEELARSMERIHEAHAVDDLRSLIKANLAFRNAWLGCVRNRHMAATISRFMDYFQAIRLDTFSDAATRRVYVDALSALFDALTARDSLASQDRMTAFLFAAETAYLAARARRVERQASVRPGRRNNSRTTRGNEGT
ncbi:GntR family transcriptional regulator [Rhizobium sp. SL86]|uniref:GntR family transcriptional regulator n=1 Tax=Rhizobium sp. SL86 TaxID=2995148 RepID=UPI002275B3F9|nr:GntR family transcriptional regulator [Rhizobium sp. SL86]MCY1667515.1 GntR family transcriptional regulator [Rhizobium sp. SL86]